MKPQANVYLMTASIWLALLAPQLANAAETGTALKADTLRVQPFADAKSAGSLSKSEALEIVSKKGAWLQVKTKKSTGWVRLLSVKRTASGSGIKGAMDVATGRAGTGKVVSTTGIRGLSAEELKAAPFNESEMQKMESYLVTKQQAQQFATAGGLSAQKVSYFKGAK